MLARDVRLWLNSRGIDVGGRDAPPRKAYEGYCKAHGITDPYNPPGGNP